MQKVQKPSMLTRRFLFNSMLAGTLALGITAGAIPAGLIDTADAGSSLRGRTSYTVRQANRLYELGKWSDAEKKYTQALRRNPNDIQARAGLSTVQAELFKLGAAEENAQKVLAKDPQNSDAMVALGLVYRNRTASSDMTYRNQRVQLLNQSAQMFQKAIQADPNNPDAHNRLGETYRMQNLIGDAEQAFRKAIELDSEYSEAQANMGTVLHAKGEVNQAIEHYNKAIKLNSKNFKAHYYLGQALADQGKYHESLKSLNTALYQKRDNAMVHTKMGEVLAAQGNEAGSISHFREAMRTKPEYFPAYEGLAKMFDARGDGELAIAELKTGLNLNGRKDDFRVAIAKLSQANGKNEQALKYYREVLSNNPNHKEALQGYAQTLLVSAQDISSTGSVAGDTGVYVDAERAIDQALQANPNDIQLHLAKLRLQRLSGKPQAAQAELQQIVNRPAVTQPDKIAKGEALLALGQYQESDQVFRQLIQANQGTPQKNLVMADILMSNGDLDMAAEAYRNVLGSQPKSVKAQRGLHRIDVAKKEASKQFKLAYSLNNWYSKKQRESAKDFYMETVSLYPRQPEAREALAKIYKKEKQYGKAAFEWEAYLNLMPNMEQKDREKIQRRIADLRQKELEMQQTGARS
ncbi:MAG: tetratricopeptide repeat protein [Vampirovibrio sp.]|nr:tetratricopeptide repeat protein [Vampirovibrio sp.]